MLQTLKLLLPALIPSWRFFDEIAPSPRIEFAVLEHAHGVAHHWQEFRPRPARLSMPHMLKRLLWNPYGNESLFMVSCAERLIANPTAHSQQEILKRISVELGRTSKAAPYVQFRLVFVSRNGEALQNAIIHVSAVHAMVEGTHP